MKKFDFKKILILVLALVLVFSLAACDKTNTCTHVDSNGDSLCDKCGADMGGGIVASVKIGEFFDKLWKASNVINSGEYGASDTIGLDADMSIGLSYGTTSAKQNMELGIALSLLIDRSPAEFVEGEGDDEIITPNPDYGKKNAAKIKLYDAKNGTDILTIYYFLDDPYFIYIDFGGQQIKIEIDMGDNDTWGAFLMDYELMGGNTIKDIAEIFLAGAGPDWNLDNLVYSAFNLIGGNITETIEKLLNSDIAKLLFSGDDVEYEGGSFLPLLKTLGSFLFNDKIATANNADGSKTYTATMNSSVVGIILGFVKIDGKTLSELTDTLIGDSTVIKLSYTLADEKIKGFSIGVTIPQVEGDKNLDISIKINKLRLTNLETVDAASESEKADAYFGIDRDNFDSEFYIDITATINEGGLFNINYNNESYSLEGVYTVNLKGAIDLSSSEINKTKLYGTIKYGSAIVAEVDYSQADTRLAIRIDNTVTTNGGAPVAPTVISVIKDFIGIEGFEKIFPGMFGSQLVDALFDENGNYRTDLPAIGIIVNDLDLIAILKDELNKKTSTNTTGDDLETASAADEEDDKYVQIGDNLYILKTKVSSYKLTFNIKNLFAAIAKGFANSDGKTSLSFTGIGSLVRGIVKNDSSVSSILNDVYLYTKNAGGSYVRQGSLNLGITNSVDNLFAYICGSIQDYRSVFVSMGYLENKSDTVTNVQAYFMWQVATGRVSYDVWQTIVPESGLSQEAYDKYVSELFPQLLLGILKGSAFATGDITSIQMLQNLAAGSLTAALGFDTDKGVYISLGLTVSEKSITIEMSINVIAGEGEFGMAVIPAASDLDADGFDESGCYWIIVAA